MIILPSIQGFEPKKLHVVSSILQKEVHNWDLD